MKKKRPSKTARARRAKGAISPDLRELVQELQRVHAEAERVGIFIGDRELLQCKTCGLTEDVGHQGKLFTYFGDVVADDTGLRFQEKKNGTFRCPSCRKTVVPPPSSDDVPL